MKKGNVIIKNASQVITCSGFEGKFGKDMNNINVIENATVVVEDGIIKEIGSLEDILKKYNEKHFEIVDASNKAVLPGFVDSHTHFVFGGFRAEEFSWRLNGESYMDIMNKGGGIVNSVRGTREATEDELYESAKKRLDSMIHFGVTTVEGKSGYGLDYETELKQLRVMDRLQKDHSIDICKTFMGAHATPEEYKGRNEEYINFIMKMFCQRLQKKN
ncbi:hypothetical protein N072000002_21710 [Clostridium tetani]|uniref:amidohydrolase family protein n=1 Tax=Clostridium tetani TaxID=1513 RepID=UPI003084751C|nr:hypothetical protein N072000002_21710 [Clostridium tetani]